MSKWSKTHRKIMKLVQDYRFYLLNDEECPILIPKDLHINFMDFDRQISELGFDVFIRPALISEIPDNTWKIDKGDPNILEELSNAHRDAFFNGYFVMVQTIGKGLRSRMIISIEPENIRISLSGV